MPITVSVLLSTRVLVPIGRPHIIWSTATQPPYTPLEPRRVPATALLLSSSLYLFCTLPPSTPAALFSPTARCSLTFLRSAHRAALCVCLTEHTVRAHFGHTYIQQGVCTVAPMSSHTYTYSFIKLIDMHSWVHTTTNAHTDFHMCTLHTHSSAYTGCLTPRFQYPYSFFYASTLFLQFDLLIPWALHIFSSPLFPHWGRWYGRCFIVIGLWTSYIKEINLNKLPTTRGKTQQKYWWRFFKLF